MNTCVHFKPMVHTVSTKIFICSFFGSIQTFTKIWSLSEHRNIVQLIGKTLKPIKKKQSIEKNRDFNQWMKLITNIY